MKDEKICPFRANLWVRPDRSDKVFVRAALSLYNLAPYYNTEYREIFFPPRENPMKKSVLLTCCLVLILLAGCAGEPIQPPTASSTPAPPSSTPAPPSSTPALPSTTPSKASFWRIVTSTITPPTTKTLTPTLTYTPSNTPVPTHTSTPPPIPIGAQNTIQCLEILPEMPDSAEASGVVVLMKDRKIYLLDMATQQLTKMSLQNEKPYDL